MPPEQDPTTRAQTRRLAMLFAALYFVQGIAEPTEGLISQPVRSLLRSWGYDAAGIGTFIFFLSLPWMVKPLYGILTDFVPVLGMRRKSWLVIMTAATALGLTVLWLVPLPEGASTLLFVLLFLPTLGVAFTDVVVDALMVDEGQPRKITGTLQSVGWGAIYTAAILTGWLGGWLSERGLQTTGFLICALAAAGSLLLAWFVVKEPPAKPVEGSAKGAARAMWSAAKHPAVIGVGAFLFLVNFSPFGSSVRYIHMTEGLGLGEEVYGKMVSVQALASVVAAGTYGWICRRVPFKLLLHGSIVLTVVSTLMWLFAADEASVLTIAPFYGFTMMLVSLVQLDMAARYCPPAVAATVFALLMALCNQAVSLSEVVGGTFYTSWIDTIGRQPSFERLVWVGAVFTGVCWVVVPFLNRLEDHGPPSDADGPGSEDEP
ncbi:MAG: MFS transporter, partial [Deltaproteobacteria bacterium]|nr:MFS transporter [Deltaproteobacteria bacterium]